MGGDPRKQEGGRERVSGNRRKAKKGMLGRKSFLWATGTLIFWGPLRNPVEHASELDLQGAGKMELLSTDSPNSLGELPPGMLNPSLLGC